MAGKQNKTYDVVKKKPVYSAKAKKADGTKAQNGTKVLYGDGRVETLLNPSGKGRKYAQELQQKAHMTNDGQLKTDRQGQVRRLTDTQAAYRGGYLRAQKDAAKAYKAKQCDGQKRGGKNTGKGGF